MNETRIIFTRFRECSGEMVNDIFAIDPDGQHEEQLTVNPGANGVISDSAAPRYNKDGSMLAYISTKNNENKRYNIFFMKLADKKTAQVTFGDLDISSVDWSPDDSALVFTSKNSKGIQQIQKVNLDGSGLTELTDGKEECTAAMWSPAGGQIAFTRFAEDGKTSHIWIMDVEGKNPVKLTSDETFHSNPSWSPDGSWLVFQRDLKIPHLRMINVHTREIVVFAAPEAGADMAPVWSGNGIVFSSNRDCENADRVYNLYWMSENGEHVQRITRNDTFEYGGDW